MIQYSINDAEVKKLLSKVKMTLKEKQKLLSIMAINIQSGLNKNFTKEVDSTDKKWKPLKQSRSRKGKKKRSIRLLRDTGAGARMDFKVNNEGAKIGSTKDYMEYHNTGTKRGLPKREWAYVGNETEGKIKTAMTRYLEKLV